MRPEDADMCPATMGLGGRWDRTEQWKCVRLLENLGASIEGIKKLQNGNKVRSLGKPTL